MNALLVLGVMPVGATSSNISHSYYSAGDIKNGSIVSLYASKTDDVEPANTDNAKRLLGVALASGDSLLAVDAGSGKIQVATSGTANVLVSTVSGDIKVGDSVGASPFNGVGAKAQPGSRVIGVAQTDFNKSTPGTTSQEVIDKSGNKKTIYIGFVRATVNVGTLDAANTSTNSLQRLGRSITGHNVSTLRVIIALVISIVAVVALIVLAYASIYGTIVSIGRNPLAKYAIFKTLGTVLGMVTLIALVAGVTVYLLLS